MAGEYAIVTGSGQGLPTTSMATLDMGSITSDADNILTETSAGVYRPDEPGQYLIFTKGLFQSTHNNRQNFLHKIQRNSADYAGAFNSGYSRNNGNDWHTNRGWMIAPFNGTTDTFRVQHQRDAGGGTPAGSYFDTLIYVLRLSDTTTALPFGHYGTPTNNSFQGSTWTNVTGWDVITETDTDVIELQAGGTEIRLKEADRPYLFVYGMKNDDSGAGRTHRVFEATLEGTRVAHTFGYEYQRNSADQHCVPASLGLVRPSLTNQDLAFRGKGYHSENYAFNGTWDNGSWSIATAANTAGVMVIALPASTNVAIFEDLTGGQNTHGANNPDINYARSTVGTADSPFSRINNTDVDVTSATDVLAYFSEAQERNGTSGTRWTKVGRVEIDGVNQTDTDRINYDRGHQSSDDCHNGALDALYIGAAAANATFQFEVGSVSGQNTGNSGFTMWAGGFFIDLASLAAGATVELDGAGANSSAGDGTLTVVDYDYDCNVDNIADEGDVDVGTAINGKDFNIGFGLGWIVADADIIPAEAALSKSLKSNSAIFTRGRGWAVPAEIEYHTAAFWYEPVTGSPSAVKIIGTFVNESPYTASRAELRHLTNGAIQIRSVTTAYDDSDGVVNLSTGDRVWLVWTCKGSATVGRNQLLIYDAEGTLLDTLGDLTTNTNTGGTVGGIRYTAIGNPELGDAYGPLKAVAGQTYTLPGLRKYVTGEGAASSDGSGDLTVTPPTATVQPWPRRRRDQLLGRIGR